MKQMTMDTLNSKPELAEFMGIVLNLPKEQQQFITEVLTICTNRDIRPDEAWNMICKEYNIPTTQELDKIF